MKPAEITELGAAEPGAADVIRAPAMSRQSADAVAAIEQLVGASGAITPIANGSSLTPLFEGAQGATQ